MFFLQTNGGIVDNTNMHNDPNLNRTVADLYEVQPSYKRFNQKYNMTRQALWNENIRPLQKKFADTQRLFVEERRNGYSILERAFLMGSGANLDNTDYVINRPNKNGNAWESVFSRESRSAPLVANKEPSEKFGKWLGNAVDTARLLQKVGRIFGANLVRKQKGLPY
jgi:hypothetical protein